MLRVEMGIPLDVTLVHEDDHNFEAHTLNVRVKILEDEEINKLRNTNNSILVYRKSSLYKSIFRILKKCNGEGFIGTPKT